MATLYVAHDAAGGGDGSIGDPMTIDEALAVISIDGNEIRLKAGAYDRLLGLVVANNLLIGCKSDWSVPTIDEPPPASIEFTAPASASLITSGATANARLRHLILGNNTGANDLISMPTTGSVRLMRCVLRNIGRSAVVAGDGLQLLGCEVYNWGLSGAAPAVNVASKHAASLIGNYIHGGTGTAATFTSSIGSSAMHNVIAACSQAGILSSYTSPDRPLHLGGNVFYDCESGVQFGSTSVQPIVSRGNLYIANDTYGVRYNGSGAPLLTLIGDGFWSNASGEISSNVQVEEPLARMSLAANPLVAAGGGDFRVRSAADLRRAGWPSTYLSAAAMTARWAYLAAGLPSHGPSARGGRALGGIGG